MINRSYSTMVPTGYWCRSWHADLGCVTFVCTFALSCEFCIAPRRDNAIPIVPAASPRGLHLSGQQTISKPMQFRKSADTC